MKQLLKKSIFSAMLLLSGIPAAQACCPAPANNGVVGVNSACGGNLNRNSRVHTHINYRSQGANTARELVGWMTELYRPDVCDYYGVATFAFEFQKTFRGERIAYDLFGASALAFQGSEVINRSPNALVADYFGLGSTFDGSISFCPEIKNYIFDWNFYVGLDSWWQGLYFRAHLPLVRSEWSLFGNNDKNCCINSCCPTIAPTTTGVLPACFVGDTASTAIGTIQEALSCGATPTGSVFGGNNAGCINFCQMEETKLADIDLILGWLAYNDDCYHLGVFLQYVAPTGTDYRDNARYAGSYFRPQIGNGHHHEFGAGLTAHAMLWDDQQSKSLAFYVEGNVTHMFGDCQCRLFDLCDAGAYSRYMLLREFDASGVPTGELVRANNTSLANRLVDVKIDAKVDFSFMFAYRHCNWGLDLGYNIYYHSQEEIDCGRNRNNRFDCNNGCYTCPTTGNQYGIAGLTGSCCFPATLATDGAGTCTIVGFPTAADTVPTAGTGVISSVTPGATMFDPALGAASPVITPDAGDTSTVCLSYSSIAAGAAIGDTCAGLTSVSTASPVTSGLLGADAINLRSGLSPAYLTHKIFTHINYMWADECGWNPFLGIGAEIEFDGNNRFDNDCFTNCADTNVRCRDNSNRVGLNQWGIWVKGGINF